MRSLYLQKLTVCTAFNINVTYPFTNQVYCTFLACMTIYSESACGWLYIFVDVNIHTNQGPVFNKIKSSGLHTLSFETALLVSILKLPFLPHSLYVPWDMGEG